MTTLQGTVALVTGASSGVGEATALALAGQGAEVAIVARRRDRLDDLAKRIADGGGRTHVIEADVSSQEQAVSCVEETLSELGRLDTLVNNAGVMLLGPIENAPVEEWDRMLAVNVQGLLYCAHAALPHLLRAAEGEPRQVADLVNISSLAGAGGPPGQRRLQPDEVRGRRFHRVAPSGGDPALCPRVGG